MDQAAEAYPELRTCPFCEGDGRMQRHGKDSYYRVTCGSCGAASANHLTAIAAARAWNRRAV